MRIRYFLNYIIFSNLPTLEFCLCRPQDGSNIKLGCFAYVLSWAISHNLFNKKKIKKLKVFAQKSLNINDHSLSIQIAHTIEQIKLLNSQLLHIELEITNLVTSLLSITMTIPKIGVVNSGIIPGEIGNIHRFSEPKKLQTFASLDLSVYQSENF